jgi:hypothetical protein
MILVGAAGQQDRIDLWDASGGITAGGTAQLLLPEAKSRSYLIIQNLDADHDLFVEFGAARATATLTSGVVTSLTITNAGFNYTSPPAVEFMGGGNSGQAGILGVGQPGYPSPGDPAYVAGRYFDMSAQRPAKATAVLTAGAVSSFAISDGGRGYQVAPFVAMRNTLRDPYGVAIASATSGFLVPHAGGKLEFNGTVCPTSAISIFGGTTNQAFCCKFAA